MYYLLILIIYENIWITAICVLTIFFYRDNPKTPPSFAAEDLVSLRTLVEKRDLTRKSDASTGREILEAPGSQLAAGQRHARGAPGSGPCLGKSTRRRGQDPLPNRAAARGRKGAFAPGSTIRRRKGGPPSSPRVCHPPEAAPVCCRHRGIKAVSEPPVPQ